MELCIYISRYISRYNQDGGIWSCIYISRYISSYIYLDVTRMMGYGVVCIYISRCNQDGGIWSCIYIYLDIYLDVTRMVGYGIVQTLGSILKELST